MTEEVEVVVVGMSDIPIDNSPGFDVSGAITFFGILGKEADVVPLSADDVCDGTFQPFSDSLNSSCSTIYQ